jgi:hypothetical protein
LWFQAWAWREQQRQEEILAQAYAIESLHRRKRLPTFRKFVFGHRRAQLGEGGGRTEPAPDVAAAKKAEFDELVKKMGIPGKD